MKKSFRFWLSVGVMGAMLAGGMCWPLPEATAGKVRSLSSGVGMEERRPEQGYSVRMVFARQSGDYLAGVKVVVWDEGGARLLETRAQGPWLYLDLAPGNYRVVATHGGREAVASITVEAGRLKKVYFSWK